MEYRESKLVEWTKAIPECEEFLNSFFMSSVEDPVTEFVNYLTDIQSYGKTYKSVRDNSHLLINAYEEITGMRIYYG
ncbi:MAG: hypothetical protein Q7S27_05695 [Nanoarchaeota archaeon]|nr:hypothetical protein [Nanoarchaeota archaeon]